MATATPSSGEGGDEDKALEVKLFELQKAKEEIVERARPLSEELTTVAQREDECRSKLHRLRTLKKQQQEGESWTVDVHAPELYPDIALQYKLVDPPVIQTSK